MDRRRGFRSICTAPYTETVMCPPASRSSTDRTLRGQLLPAHWPPTPHRCRATHPRHLTPSSVDIETRSSDQAIDRLFTWRSAISRPDGLAGAPRSRTTILWSGGGQLWFLHGPLRRCCRNQQSSRSCSTHGKLCQQLQLMRRDTPVIVSVGPS